MEKPGEDLKARAAEMERNALLSRQRSTWLRSVNLWTSPSCWNIVLSRSLWHNSNSNSKYSKKLKSTLRIQKLSADLQETVLSST